jgi:hypothetical protein
MELPDFTIEHLKRLPLRAIVAFAARCARRVETLGQLPEGEPERERRQSAIDAAIRLAEDFARGANTPPDPAVIERIDAIRAGAGGSLSSQAATAAATAASHAAASAWHALGTREDERYKPPEGRTAEAGRFLGALGHATVDLAALNAYTAAVQAFGAVGYRNEDFVAAALNDYGTLIRLNLGRYPDAGEPVDTTQDGPLGPL